MRVLVQRVSRAAVRVDGREVASIGRGLIVLLGVETTDDAALAEWYARRLLRLKLFEGSDGRPWSRSVTDAGGAVVVVSQFTLPARTRKGLRPSFDPAAPPELARDLYERFAGEIEAAGVPVGRGEFGARMDVELVNDGPVTFLLDGPARDGGAR